VLGNGGSQSSLWRTCVRFNVVCRKKSRIAYLAVIDVTDGT
jgi:hypothetical protein